MKTQSLIEKLASIEEKAKLLEQEKKVKNLAKKSLALTFVIDTREQKPYSFNTYTSIYKKLDVGDYSLLDFENQISVERKSLDDFISTVIYQQERFKNELNILKEYEQKCIILEATYTNIVNHQYTSNAHPNAVLAIIQSIIIDYNIPVYFLENHAISNQFVEKYLTRFAIHKQRQFIAEIEKPE